MLGELKDQVREHKEKIKYGFDVMSDFLVT